MTDQDDRFEAESVRDAVDWFARLGSDAASTEDWAEFEAWLAADPAHEDAFRTVEALWLDLDPAAASDVRPFPRRVAKARSAVPNRNGRASGVSRPGRSMAVGLAAAGLAALGLVIAGGAFFLRPLASEISVETPVNQIRTLGLHGGVATMEGGTRLELIETPAGQRVRLLKGAARFRLQHDPARRLTVLAGGEQITDIGTVFTTRFTASGLEVSVSEGEVEVQPSASPGRPLRIRAGQALIRRAGQASSQVLAADLTALRRPYQDAPLASVVADLNQFFSRPIAIEGADAARLRFTGVLILDSQDAVVRRLEAYLPISARTTAARVLIASRRGRSVVPEK